MAKSNKGRKFFATTATAALVASAIVPVASAAQINDFNSISSYAQEAVQDLNDRGIIKGDQKGNFNPKSAITRAEAATILANALELEGSGSTSFTDVKKSAWYYDAIDAAVANGIFQGQGAGKFNPSANLTRSEAAIILVDAFGLEGTADLKEFKDEASVKSWAEEALSIAVKNGVMKGDDNGNLKPNASITRQDFALMYYRTEAAEGTEEVSGSVKAINNTTVEVTFTEEVANVKALDFAIEGLDITNAAVKQTDKKTVVLTTSAQTADVEYTVTLNGEAIGKFKGVTAVIPTKIDVTTKSVQGVIGEQVTLTAKVEVAQGQSAENIPVTFNIVNNTSTNDKVEAEVLTKADGTATYSYTRYYGSEDTFTAYATKKSSVFSTGKVYWANAKQLTITEKVAENALTNGAKKVYEISAPAKAGKYVFVTFTNNVGVTTDKLTRSVFAEGTGLWEQQGTVINTTASGTGQFPYEITNGANRVVPVLLDSKGKANLVLSGTNGKVTPVVYDGVLKTSGLSANPGSVSTDFANILYNPTALQAKAPEVSFDIKHTLGLKVEAKGVSNAAVAIPGTVQTGGRDYTATYVDKDGKPAKAGDIVNVAIQNRAGSTANAFLVDADGNELAHTTGDGYKYYALAVKGTEGKVNFTVASYNEEAFATPIVFVDNGTGPDAHKSKLDASDLQAQSESVYFTKTVQYQAELVALDKNGDETKSVRSGGDEYVEYAYNLLDQNGKPRAYTAATNVTFNFTAGTNAIVAGGKVITPGNPGSVTNSIAAGELSTSVRVTSAQAGSVTGYATASRVGAGAITSTEAVNVLFTATSTLVVRGTLDATIAPTATQISIDGVPYSLTGATYLNNGTVVPTLQAFRAHLVAGVTVDVTKDKDGNLVFNVLPATSSNVYAEVATQLNNAVTQAEAIAALKKIDGFSKFIVADQKDIADALLVTATPYTAATLKTAYEAADDDAVDTLAAITSLDEAIAEAEAVVKNAVVGSAVGQYTQANLDTLKTAVATAKTAKTAVVDGTTASSGASNANQTALNSAESTLDSAVATFKSTAVTNASLQAAALAAVNTALLAQQASANATNLLAAQKAIVDNATILGLDLTGYNNLTGAQKDTAVSAVATATPVGGYTTSSELNTKFVAETDAIAPKVTKAVFDGTDTLTLTFDEAISLTAGTIASGSVAFETTLGGTGTVALATAFASVSGKDLVLTLDTTDITAQGFTTGVTITNVTILDNTPVTPVAIKVKDAKGNITTDFTVEVK